MILVQLLFGSCGVLEETAWISVLAVPLSLGETGMSFN